MNTLSRLLLTCLAAASAPAMLAQEPVKITLRTLTAQMRFDPAELTVSPGARVQLTFENPDDMPHNVVFCAPGTDVEQLVLKMLERPEEAMKNSFLPSDPRVWMKSRLLNPHETQVIEFTAPDKAGSYPYVCSFPGHASSMKGSLRVLSEAPKLQDLQFALYHGDWKTLPDFSKLTPHRTGAVADNLIQLNFDDYKNQYGLVFTGKLNFPNDGEYTFYCASDDGCRILVDGERVLNADGIHGAEMREAKKKIKKGLRDVRVEYFQAAGGAQLYVGWRPENFDTTALSAWKPEGWRLGSTQKKNEFVGLPLEPKGSPIIYRNFIAGAGNRGIAVGFPGGLNFAWSAESMNLALAWRGAFIDAARHWKSRGGGHQNPAGFDVVRPTDLVPPLAVLDSSDAAWPTLAPEATPEGYAWKGYQLDQDGVPTFRYAWNGVEVEDHVTAKGDFKTGGSLERRISLKGKLPAQAFLLLARSAKITRTTEGFVVEAGKLSLNGTAYDNHFTLTAEGATVSGGNLVVPARNEILVRYTWPALHPAHSSLPRASQ
jgi:plastocyanin